ncbi:MAG: AraC family transcriptional regulator [Clostridia bacterium]|nr:AraC family transcriptional regulator [Clostridia bacterium]
MFYESHNSLGADVPKFECGTDFSFPLHLHGSFELVTVTEGEMLVTVEKQIYRLTPGNAVLVFPHQVHGLSTEAHSCHFLCIFPPTLVQAYTKTFHGKVPEDAAFTPSSEFLSRLMDEETQTNPLLQKGLLYALCGEFDRGRVYREREYGNEALLFRIFSFVEQNYRSDTSLAALARHTSYHYVYLSRYFRECTGMPYAEYVARYRMNEACYLLKNTDRTVLQVAYDCGFDSLRTFNRNFKKILGVPPSAYRET